MAHRNFTSNNFKIEKMDKTDNLATEYAQNNSDQILLLLAKAYQDGYNQGICDSTHKINIDDVEYLDLGLPSGTLWSFPPYYCNYGWKLKLLPYEQVKDLNLPTREQWEELCQHCRIVDKKIIAPNGIRFGYPSRSYTIYTLGEQCAKGHNRFWMKSEPDDDHNVSVIEFDKDVNTYKVHFTGYKLPFFLVKTAEPKL